MLESQPATNTTADEKKLTTKSKTIGSKVNLEIKEELKKEKK
jgi:hypothetical protein